MYFCKVMFDKTIFSFPRKLPIGLESVSAKHPLRENKKTFNKKLFIQTKL